MAFIFFVADRMRGAVSDERLLEFSESNFQGACPGVRRGKKREKNADSIAF
jgi:hypothetical protein